MSTTKLGILATAVTALGTDGLNVGEVMLIENATAEVHAARRRHLRELEERGRLRRLVERIDVVVEACEETHLTGIKECPPDLAAQADRAFTVARRVVRLTGEPEAYQTTLEVSDRSRRKITEVMDGLWTIQETVFDLMLPWRTELPEDVEIVGSPVPGIWRYDSAA